MTETGNGVRQRTGAAKVVPVAAGCGLRASVAGLSCARRQAGANAGDTRTRSGPGACGRAMMKCQDAIHATIHAVHRNDRQACQRFPRISHWQHRLFAIRHLHPFQKE